jgi:hypothetical protein
MSAKNEIRVSVSSDGVAIHLPVEALAERGKCRDWLSHYLVNGPRPGQSPLFEIDRLANHEDAD